MVFRLAAITRCSSSSSPEGAAQPHRLAYEEAERNGNSEEAVKAAMRLAQVYEEFAVSTVKVGFDVGVEVKAQFWGKRDGKGVVREKGWIVDKGEHVLFPGKITEVLTSGVDEAEDPTCSSEQPCFRVAWDDGDKPHIVPRSRLTERASRAHEGELKEKARAMSLKWLKKAAAHGDPKAMNNVGTFYERDDLDEEQALAWYRKAAEKDHSLGKYNLAGLLYKNDEFEEALTWYKKAHEAGYLQATRSVAVLYSKQQGVKYDPEKNNQMALKWYLKAAEKGCSLSMADYGQRLHEGFGAAKKKSNKKKGIEWLKKAAEQGEERAKGFLDDLAQHKEL